MTFAIHTPCPPHTLNVPYEELPDGPDDDDYESQEPALHDEEGNGQHDGVGVIFDHDEELRHCDGSHQPRLLAQLLVELPVRTAANSLLRRAGLH